ncbi:hypothetical protein ZIOFF_031071 [Zingiber officinale]|uniref:PB1 domain-containing protein n=1 Tax=Zingiber officinale TaxID=94328 RepID=A0A8J5GUB2_ZINOF|nr:hypothetical protein ZIOFF_031071 [Zingiber officinale]
MRGWLRSSWTDGGSDRQGGPPNPRVVVLASFRLQFRILFPSHSRPLLHRRDDDAIQQEEKETISMSNRQLRPHRQAIDLAAASAGGEDDYCPSSSSSALLSSPKNARVKFLCSFGGKILPRPSDGRLKYVGGDTRVLVVTRAVSFSELRERVQAMFRRCKVIKYQLVSEDLDILVTVAGDEDLAHMLDEYDRVDALHPRSPSAVSSPRFRLFLFPSPSPSSASDTASAATLGQRYVDTINAVMPGSPPIFSISNASSGANSPTSTTECSSAFFASRPVALGGGGMHRVRSSPDLAGGCSMNQTGGPHWLSSLVHNSFNSTNTVLLLFSFFLLLQEINMSTSTSSSFLFKTFPQSFLQRSHFHCHNHTNKCSFGLTRSKIHLRPLLLVVSSSSAAGVAVVGQGQDSKYLAREGQWGVRRMVKVGEEMRKVAHVQAEAFHTPVALFDDLFFDFFKAEVISALSYRVLNSPPDRYACLVAEAVDEHSSSWEPQKEIVGVVDVTVQRDYDVLSHIQGEGEYLYVSGIAVLTKFR